MSDIETDFQNLIFDGGAFDQLEDAILGIRTILLESRLSHEEEKKLGHAGLPGEYANSLWPVFKHATKILANNPEANLKNSIQILFICLSKPSQLSISSSRELFGTIPSVQSAFKHELRLTREWVETTEKITSQKKDTMNNLLDICQKNFDEILSFRAKYQPSAHAA
jgi:hypothetical protein